MSLPLLSLQLVRHLRFAWLLQFYAVSVVVAVFTISDVLVVLFVFYIFVLLVAVF